MIRLQSFLLLIYVEILLKRKGFKFACEAVKKKKKLSKFKSIESNKLCTICYKINKAVDESIFFPHAQCLHRSLIGYYILSRKGIDVNFHLGVASDNSFASHAWLEVGGIVINDNTEFVRKFNLLMKF